MKGYDKERTESLVTLIISENYSMPITVFRLVRLVFFIVYLLF